MNTLIVFIISLCLFFFSWSQADKTGKSLWYIDMVACGVLSVVCAFRLGGII